jgi:hypothetical protein
VASTVPIIVPFATFMTRPTVIRDTSTIIRGRAITAITVGVINPVSEWGKLGAPVERPLQSYAAV